MKIRWFSVTSLLLAVLMFMLAFANVGSAQAGNPPPKVYWCHTEPNGNQQTLHLPMAALINAGHVNAQGNPLHAGDHAGACTDPTATPVTPTSPATYVVCRFKGGEWSTDNIGAPDLANFYAQFPSGFIVDDEHPCPPEDTSTPTPVVTEVTPTDPACGDGENQQPCVTETVVPTVTPVVIDTPVGIWVPTCEEMSKMSPNEFVRWTNRWVNLKDANGLSCDERGFHTGDGNGFATILFGVGALLALLGVGSFVFGKKV